MYIDTDQDPDANHDIAPDLHLYLYAYVAPDRHFNFNANSHQYFVAHRYT